MTWAAHENNRVIPRLVRGTHPSIMLVQVARTIPRTNRGRAMTLRGWCANRFVRFRASPWRKKSVSPRMHTDIHGYSRGPLDLGSPWRPDLAIAGGIPMTIHGNLGVSVARLPVLLLLAVKSTQAIGLGGLPIPLAISVILAYQTSMNRPPGL